MKRFALFMLAFVGLLVHGQESHLSSSGLVVFENHPFLRHMEVQIRAENWKIFSNNSDKKDSGKDVVRGTIPLSAPLEAGNAIVDVKKTSGKGITTYEYTLKFDKSQVGRGTTLGLILPTKGLIGSEFVMLPSGNRRELPKSHVVTSLGSESGFGVAFKQSNGKYLVVSQDAVDSILLQDSRAFNCDFFELRFGIGATHPRAGKKYSKTIQFQEVTAAELEVMCKEGQKAAPEIGEWGKKLVFLAETEGVCRLLDGSDRLMSVHVAVHGLKWKYASQDQSDFSARNLRKGTQFSGVIKVPGHETATIEVEQRLIPQNGFKDAFLSYDFDIMEDVELNGYQISIGTLLPQYIGAKITLGLADGKGSVKEMVIPKEIGARHTYASNVQSIKVDAVNRSHSFEIVFESPVRMLLQDNRGWGMQSFEYRVTMARSENGSLVKAGRTRAAFTLKAGGGEKEMVVVSNSTGIPSRTDTSTWFPYVLAWDRPSPVDVSFLNEKPAGARGFIKVDGDKFVTANDGKEIRFWGTCFSAGANFPTHEQAEKIAKRLASYGINMVRTHHADAGWAENHLFPKKADNTRVFDKENLDRFDYLIYCLKREGIYIYLDQLVNRKFKAGDGVDNVKELPVCGKPYSYFDRKLIELQKEFSKNLWTHVNPYTGLAYKDDPAIAMMEFANENDLFSQKVTLEPYRTRFEAMYREWASKKGIVLPEGKIDFTVNTDPMVAFFIHVHDTYHKEMGDYLRGLGVRVPMTGSNWTRGSSLLASLAKLDFTDSHTYWQHPNKRGFFGTASMLRSRNMVMDGLGGQKVVGRPFFVSEWDAPWPYEYRAELPVWMAAAAAFQDWNGLTVYTYRHSSKPVDFISGAFETFNDPARFGLFPVASLLYRRRDVSAGATLKRLAYSTENVATTKAYSPYSFKQLKGLSCVNRFAMEFDPKGDNIIRVDDEADKSTVLVSENGQIKRDLEAAVLRIETDRSQAVSSFFKPGETYNALGLTVTVPEEKFGTVAVSSLTDEAIVDSSKLMVIVVGRCENTGFSFTLLRNRKMATGKGPILCEPVNPTVSIKTNRKNAAVYPVSDKGEIGAALPSTYANGALTFKATAKTIYYIVQ